MDLANLIHGFAHQPPAQPLTSSFHHKPFCRSSSSPSSPSSSAGEEHNSSLASCQYPHQGPSSSNSGRTSSPPTSPESSSQSYVKQTQPHHDNVGLHHHRRTDRETDNRDATSSEGSLPQLGQPSTAPIQPSYFYPMDPNDPRSLEDETGVPVFEPTMEQFQDFYRFCEAIDHWGMKSGIVKIVPPKEWLDALPSLRAADVAQQKVQATASGSALPNLESVRIKSAIAQHFTPAAKPGLWRQTNVTRPAKVWNVKQWADICRELSGPSMERVKEMSAVREMMEKGTGGAKADNSGIRTRSGKGRAIPSDKSAGSSIAQMGGSPSTKKRKMALAPLSCNKAVAKSELPDSHCSPDVRSRLENASYIPAPSSTQAELAADGHPMDSANFPTPPLPDRILHEGCHTQPLSDKAKVIHVSKPKFADLTSRAEWETFDYRTAWLKEWQGEQGSSDEGDTEAQLYASDLSPRVCREVENEYWRGLNFGKPPMYGADLRGSLFTPLTTTWNVSNLDNLLTRLKLKRKIAGVTDPYLYFGMWRATFAWHVEDMDLYSINYIHFGAPKQWYAIPQRDRLRFETALASVFPSDARRCSQFMRHKSFLASPSFLTANNIRPIKVVQHAQEFVITYPFGYHSGYNLGFNCAESVNFALESWLDIGRKAKACDCADAQQSVTMDVDALLEESNELTRAEQRRKDKERKAKEECLLGEEHHRKKEEARIRKNERSRLKRLQACKTSSATKSGSHPSSLHDTGVTQINGQGFSDGAMRSEHGRTSTNEIACVFCPTDMADDMIPIPSRQSNAREALFAHRFCAGSIPETWVALSVSHDGAREEVQGYENISKARWALRCAACPNLELAKQGCCVQCTFGNCSKAAHASCASMEATGWVYEYFTPDEADRLEGKGRYASKGKKGKAIRGFASHNKVSVMQPSASTPSPIAPEATIAEQTTASNLRPGSVESEAGANERLVVLCRNHNPRARSSDAARKVRLIAQCVSYLQVGQQLQIKNSGGSWETTLLAFGDRDTVIVDGGSGTRTHIKKDRIVFPAGIVATAEAALSTVHFDSALSLPSSSSPPMMEYTVQEEKPNATAMEQLLAAVSAAPS